MNCADVMDMALHCYYCVRLLAQNLVDRLTIVTSSVEEYLPTVKEPFDKVRMQYMSKTVNDKRSRGLILDLLFMCTLYTAMHAVYWLIMQYTIILFISFEIPQIHGSLLSKLMWRTMSVDGNREGLVWLYVQQHQSTRQAYQSPCKGLLCPMCHEPILHTYVHIENKAVSQQHLIWQPLLLNCCWLHSAAFILQGTASKLITKWWNVTS